MDRFRLMLELILYGALPVARLLARLFRLTHDERNTAQIPVAGRAWCRSMDELLLSAGFQTISSGRFQTAGDAPGIISASALAYLLIKCPEKCSESNTFMDFIDLVANVLGLTPDMIEALENSPSVAALWRNFNAGKSESFYADIGSLVDGAPARSLYDIFIKMMASEEVEGAQMQQMYQTAGSQGLLPEDDAALRELTAAGSGVNTPGSDDLGELTKMLKELENG